jgi:hypothetical protein
MMQCFVGTRMDVLLKVPSGFYTKPQRKKIEEKWKTVKRSLRQQTSEIISEWRFRFRVSFYLKTEKFCLIVQHIFRLKR